MAKLLAEEGTKSEAPANVSPADEIPYIGHVTAPFTAAADEDARTGPKD